MSDGGGYDEDFVERLIRSVRRIARSRASDYTLVDYEDLGQEVLERYLKSWGATEGPDNLDAWIETTTRNLIIDRARAAAARPTSAVDEALFWLFRSMEVVSLQVLGDEVERAVYSLISEEERDLLQARFGWGESAAEVAEQLGIAPAAVDQRVARAKKKLRDGLEANPALLDALRNDPAGVYSKHDSRPR